MSHLPKLKRIQDIKKIITAMYPSQCGRRPLSWGGVHKKITEKSIIPRGKGLCSIQRGTKHIEFYLCLAPPPIWASFPIMKMYTHSAILYFTLWQGAMLELYGMNNVETIFLSSIILFCFLFFNFLCLFDFFYSQIHMAIFELHALTKIKSLMTL